MTVSVWELKCHACNSENFQKLHFNNNMCFESRTGIYTRLKSTQTMTGSAGQLTVTIYLHSGGPVETILKYS